MHAYTFFSTVILCHLSEEGIQIILTLHSEDILKIFFFYVYFTLQLFSDRGRSDYKKAKQPGQWTEDYSSAHHTAWQQASIIEDSHADRIPSYNSSENFPTMHTNIQMKENKLLSL